MRLHRFYSSEPLGEGVIVIKVEQNKDIFNQIHNVFRAEIGYTCIFFDGKNNIDYVYRLDSKDKKTLNFTKVEEIIKEEREKSERTLCLALIKKDGFEEVVQKAVEIGVSKIIPILSERSEKKLINKERLEKIIIEAVEQSGRNDLPTLSEISNLEDVIRLEGKHLLFHTEGETSNVEENKDNMYAWVGPEGGWTAGELEIFKNSRARLIHLPTYTLRATTAGVLASYYIVNL